MNWVSVKEKLPEENIYLFIYTFDKTSNDYYKYISEYSKLNGFHTDCYNEEVLFWCKIEIPKDPLI
jgi:hypothetical protein